MKILSLSYRNIIILRFVGGVCDEAADNVLAAINAGVNLSQGKTAILSRCNVTVFSEAVRLTDVNPLCRVHFIGVSPNIL